MLTRSTYTCLACLAVAATSFLSLRTASAGSLYWDNNDSAAGFGTAGGTWSNAASSFSSDITGQTSVTGTVVSSAADIANFGTATDGLATGTITVTGTVTIGALAFGSASGGITFGAGTNADIDFGNAAATLTVNTSSAPRSNVQLTGITNLTKDGAGTFTLNANAAVSGTVFVNQGTLRLGASTGSGAINNATSMVVASGAFVEYARTNTTTPGYTISGGGTVTMDRVGTLTLAQANSYSGGTFISAGTVATSGAGTVGAGNITLSDDPGQTGGSVLTLVNNAGIGDGATLTFATSGTTINLNFTGADTLAAITNGTTSASAGTYTAAQLNTLFGGSNFAGTGSLTVAGTPVPEPASVGILGLTSLGLLLRRRRR
jgi:autotransporter-associated beta strand protein